MFWNVLKCSACAVINDLLQWILPTAQYSERYKRSKMQRAKEAKERKPNFKVSNLKFWFFIRKSDKMIFRVTVRTLTESRKVEIVVVVRNRNTFFFLWVSEWLIDWLIDSLQNAKMRKCENAEMRKCENANDKFLCQNLVAQSPRKRCSIVEIWERSERKRMH